MNFDMKSTTSIFWCKFLFTAFLIFATTNCRNKTLPNKNNNTKEEVKPNIGRLLTKAPIDVRTPEGMLWIPGGTFTQGAVPHDKEAMAHEKPSYDVAVDGFYMDITEVTNAQFEKFATATGYRTVAERPVDWEELKMQLPEGTPKPNDSIMQPGSLVFKKSKTPLPNLYDFSQWWQWSIGANWRHPEGPDSNLKGKENQPVVHIAYEDALAYCEWIGRRLPTEAEWEYAARGGSLHTIYPWGNDTQKLAEKVNSWEGDFPISNTKKDGFEKRAMVKSYPSNKFGLYDMTGNVWEWTSDWYNSNYYKKNAASQTILLNPEGAKTPFNARSPYAKERVIKGGSFLCSSSYCASYRVSARMACSIDSAMEHLGFRTVVSAVDLRNSN